MASQIKTDFSKKKPIKYWITGVFFFINKYKIIGVINESNYPRAMGGGGGERAREGEREMAIDDKNLHRFKCAKSFKKGWVHQKAKSDPYPFPCIQKLIQLQW